MPLSDFQTLTTALHRDDSGKILPADRDAAIAAAVNQLSLDRPRTKVEDVASTGPNVLPLPAGWQADFSAIRSIEYPIGRVPPVCIPPDRYGFYQLPAGTIIVQLLDAVNTGDQIRVAYAIRHVLDVSTDTIAPAHREAVCCWAAALICDQLASLYANASDTTIQADVVDRTSKAREFAARAKTLRQRYYDALGINPKANAAAGVEVNLSLPTSQGRDRLTHANRMR